MPARRVRASTDSCGVGDMDEGNMNIYSTVRIIHVLINYVPLSFEALLQSVQLRIAEHRSGFAASTMAQRIHTHSHTERQLGRHSAAGATAEQMMGATEKAY